MTVNALNARVVEVTIERRKVESLSGTVLSSGENKLWNLVNASPRSARDQKEDEKEDEIEAEIVKEKEIKKEQ